MEEIKIHSGTRVKLKHLREESLPQDFLLRLREFAHKTSTIQAIFMFALEAEGQPEQPSLAIAIRSGMFGARDEEFLHIVDEIQMTLPEELALNLYRFGASEQLARYCVRDLEPIYLRSTSWLDKQRKKLKEPSRDQRQ